MATTVKPVIFQCKRCGEIYLPAQLDGSIFHHVCRPVLEPATGRWLIVPNARNENILMARNRRPAGIISEGLGVDCLTDPSILEPAWIARLKQRVSTPKGQARG